MLPEIWTGVSNSLSTMDLDPLSIVAPARVRVLLLPAGQIRKSSFSRFVGRLQDVNIVRLGDVSPDSRPNRSENPFLDPETPIDQVDMTDMFSPLAFPEGLILYDLSTSLPPQSHLALSPFEIYREPLVVAGIADGNNLSSDVVPMEEKVGTDAQKENKSSRVEKLKALVRTLEDLLDNYPRALVHQILVFDHDEDSLPERIYSVPSAAKSRTTTIKTVMCDLTARLLAEMSTYAKSIQALPSLDSPRIHIDETSGGVISALPPHVLELPKVSNSRSHSPIGDTSRSEQRMSVPASLTFGGKATPPAATSRPTSPYERANTPSSSVTDVTASKPPDQDRASSRGRYSATVSGSGSIGERERNRARGRIGVVIGALYLLAGRWPDAVKELVSSATMARNTSDYLWHAKAMDYVLVCLLMFAWAGMDFRVSSQELDAFKLLRYLWPWASEAETSRYLKTCSREQKDLDQGRASPLKPHPPVLCRKSIIRSLLMLPAVLSHCRISRVFYLTWPATS